MFLGVTGTLVNMTEGQREDWASRVRQARVTMGWSKEEAARRAGISSITWKRVEDGLPVQDAKLERVLGAIKEMEYGTTPLREVGRAVGSWPFGVSKDSADEIAIAVRLLEGQLDIALTEEQHAQVAMQAAHGRVEHLLGQIGALTQRYGQLTEKGSEDERPPITQAGGTGAAADISPSEFEAALRRRRLEEDQPDDMDPAEFPLGAAARRGDVEPGEQDRYNDSDSDDH